MTSDRIRPALLAALLSACSAQPAIPADGNAAPASSASAAIAPAATAPAISAAPAAPPASAAAATPTAAPTDVPAAPTATASADAPVPSVKVVNIGMHIGGGPNDNVTKEPIRRSVEPHFDAFRRCFGLLADQKKGGDFGVDLRIERAGGKAKVSHPRTALKGKEFEACVVRTYEGIDFIKPKTGATTVSYSLRFTP